MAVAIAGAADAVSEIAVLRDREELFGAVASMPTPWRVLDRVDSVRLGAVQLAGANELKSPTIFSNTNPVRYISDHAERVSSDPETFEATEGTVGSTGELLFDGDGDPAVAADGDQPGWLKWTGDLGDE